MKVATRITAPLAAIALFGSLLPGVSSADPAPLCNEATIVGGGALGVSPGPLDAPGILGWDVGSGQCNGSFSVASDPDFPGGLIELGLRVEQRRIGQVAPSASNDYTVETGADVGPPLEVTRAWWNFQISVARELDMIENLDSLTLSIRTDVGPNQPSTEEVDLLPLRTIIDDRNQPNATNDFADLYQISQNPEFGWFAADEDNDANVSGAFDYDAAGAWLFTLKATEGTAVTELSVCIHTPGETCLPAVDTEAPMVIAPPDLTVEATAPQTPVDLESEGVVLVSDNVDESLIATPDFSGPFPVGSTPVTWSATDSSDNTGSAVQTVLIVDNTPPSIVAPVSITVISPGPDEIVDIGQAAASDTASPVTITHDAPASFDVDTVTTVNWTAVDASGNSSSDTQTITITKADTDGDGVCDPGGLVGEFSNCSFEDNCPLTPNANQANLDGDEFGDVCDRDIDGDSLSNRNDVCPLTEIPENAPSVSLRRNRFALTQTGDGLTPPKFTSTSRRDISIVDTGGCSCTEILEASGSARASEAEFGCTTTTMVRWIRNVPEPWLMDTK